MCYTRPRAAQCTHPCATHLRASCSPTPLMQCTNVRVLHMSVCWYKLRPCATHCHVRVLCTLLIQATHVRRRPCVGQSCEPLIQATSSSVVFTTVTSYTRPRDFLIHFFYYIRYLHILHASFSTCACDLNKTDGLRNERGTDNGSNQGFTLAIGITT